MQGLEQERDAEWHFCRSAIDVPRDLEAFETCAAIAEFCFDPCEQTRCAFGIDPSSSTAQGFAGTQVRSISSTPSKALDSQQSRAIASSSAQAPRAQVKCSVASSSAHRHPEGKTKSVPSFPSPILATQLRPIVTTAAPKPSVGSSTKSSPRVKVRASSNVHFQDRKLKFEDMEDLVKPLKQILPALQEVVPSLAPNRHKGQAGERDSVFFDFEIFCLPLRFCIKWMEEFL